MVNILKPGQNDRHSPDDIFKCIFVNKIALIWSKISSPTKQAISWTNDGKSTDIYTSLSLNELKINMSRCHAFQLQNPEYIVKKSSSNILIHIR